MQDGLFAAFSPVHACQTAMARTLDELSQSPRESELGPWWALDHQARIIADLDGRIVRADPLARSILETRAGIFLRHERLTAVERQFQPTLERNLCAPIGVRMSFLIPAGNAGSLLFQTIRFAGVARDGVAVSVRLISDDFAPEYKCLAEAFDLTSAEELVAQQLLEGATPVEISKHCSLSIHTIRTHIAHVHAKLGVNSREAMWRRCAAYQVG